MMPFGGNVPTSLRVSTNEELSFLEAVHANPRDDGIRLIYADWLEEHGQADHAELIRLQCEAPHVPVSISSDGPPTRNELLPVGPDFPETLRKAARIKDILRRIFKGLFYPVPTGAKRGGQSYRGMPEYKADLGGEMAATAVTKLVARLSTREVSSKSYHRKHRGVGRPSRHAACDRLDISLSRDRGKAALGAADLRALAGSVLPDRLVQLMIYAPMEAERRPCTAQR